LSNSECGDLRVAIHSLGKLRRDEESK
jgi:hypothetical protein